MEEIEGRLSSPFTKGIIQFNNFVPYCKGLRLPFGLLKSNHTPIWRVKFQSNLRENRYRRPFKFMVA
ncbi:hypothetical protein CR513_09522, partial [Mucuna pruriens]